MTWKLVDHSTATWDQSLTDLSITSPYQLGAWGDFRADDGWNTLRFIDSGHSSRIQILTRRFGPLAIAWSPGGPTDTTSAESLHELQLAIRDALGAAFFYIRVSDSRPDTTEHNDSYISAGWHTCSHRVSAKKTLILNLPNDPELLPESYSTNWTRNLRRGQKRDVIAEHWVQPEARPLAEVYKSVLDLKKTINVDWRLNPARVESFLSHFADSLIVIRAVDRDGETLAYRAALVRGKMAFDILAGTSPIGRKCYASHVVTHRLLQDLVVRGCERFDFGGIDVEGNRGVYDFKHGTGGVEQRYVGEYDFSVPKLLTPVISKLLISRTS